MREPEDEAAFDAFFADAWGRLVSQAYLLTGNRETAQDLTQEAFLRAWKRWRKVTTYDSPEAWTRKVLHNLCIESWRRKRLEARHSGVDRAEVVDERGHDHELVEAMKSLPGPQARALLLHDGLGLTVADTARELEVPDGTVKSWLSRGRRVVRARMSPSQEVDRGEE